MADTGVPCADTNVTDGNSCHYQCDEGYQLTGSTIVVCDSSAQWNGTVPSCVGKFRFLIIIIVIIIIIIGMRRRGARAIPEYEANVICFRS